MNIIRIAICDDEVNIRNYLSTLIRRQAVPCDIQEYASADALFSEEMNFDLLFLDIELGGSPDADRMDGLSLARRIRDRNLSPQPLIIFVTGHEKYVYDAFDVNAFQYLVKPVDERKFAEVFGRAAAQISAGVGQNLQKLVVQFGGTSRIIARDSIYYIESHGHKAVLHLKEETVEYYAKLRELERELAGQFFRIHKGYMVNLAWVEEYNRSEVIMINGDKLLISKYKYADFVKAHLRFLQQSL
ncbi:LytR/AlgR family response regulator transcription factor [Acetatifactor muris]|uniref:LytR/AlgR family response regulator transcription factor n=1 Tax=Acetatifactor muris TaxID=879566 RepID=UPI0023EFEF7E|nr:LytTR family DNA-binding domain-containing protein [Acetatifactor muris]